MDGLLFVPVSHENSAYDTRHAELNGPMRVDSLGLLTHQEVVDVVDKVVDLHHDLLLHDVLSEPEISKDVQCESPLFSPEFAWENCFFDTTFTKGSVAAQERYIGIGKATELMGGGGGGFG